MTDDHSPFDLPPSPHPTGPLDDEVISAVLDGEATPGERALVEGSVEGRARLAELRAVAEATAQPVAPLAHATVDAMVGRALDTAAPAAAPAATPVALSGRRERRARTVDWRRVGAAVAAVAAVVVLVVGVAALLNVSSQGTSSSDSASSATADAGGGSTSATAGVGAGTDSLRSAAGVVPPDLGSLGDASVVLDRYAVLIGLDPSIDHQFDGGSTSGSGAVAAESASQAPAADATPAAPTACPVPPVAAAPGERWTVTATAKLPEGPVLVMGNGLASPANRVLVIDAVTCTVLAERTL